MALKDAIRIVLVDPIDDTRQALQRMIGGVSEVWLADVCSQYEGTDQRVVDIGPDLVLVVLDSDPLQAIQLVQAILQRSPNVAVLPASRDRDSGVILRVIRAGAREFLPLPTEASDLVDSVKRLIRPREETQTSGVRGPQIITITGARGAWAAPRWPSTWGPPWPSHRRTRQSSPISTFSSDRSTPVSTSFPTSRCRGSSRISTAST